ncbi:hypothetical protein AWM70_15640 [Paenibacillus yonginensis]|uniref:Uncharacterized protein n=1 Tax=Paenibacillus yonginensis TaxID=1462996 RepID=A0A1B1N338_9BACL|nr:hypothetical protein AWM70_15640 [Paenibacillus yonginensis]
MYNYNNDYHSHSHAASGPARSSMCHFQGINNVSHSHWMRETAAVRRNNRDTKQRKEDDDAST